MKKFLKERSKLMLVTCIISVIIVILTIPEFVNESNWIKTFVETFNEISPNLTEQEIHLALSSSDMINLTSIHMIILTCISFISAILNVASYIYKKLEFQFLSISFLILLILVNCTMFDIGGILFFSLLIILNILAYISQYKINKKTKN